MAERQSTPLLHFSGNLKVDLLAQERGEKPHPFSTKNREGEGKKRPYGNSADICRNVHFPLFLPMFLLMLTSLIFPFRYV